MDVVVIFILWFTPSLVIGLALGYVLSRLDGWHRGGRRRTRQGTCPMKILSWEPMTLLGRPVPDQQRAVLDDPDGVTVTIVQNGWGAHHALVTIHTAEHEADVIVSWPNAEPDHGIPEDAVKAWVARYLGPLVEMFGSKVPDGEVP